MKLRVLLWVGVALVAAVSASTDADRALSSLDSDNDGVPNARDACPHTTRAVHVDAIGCSEMQVDNDYDHVCDRSRPKVKSTGDYARTKWCTGLDNCKYVRNPGQRDHDNDGHGDACDTGTFAVMGVGFGVVVERVALETAATALGGVGGAGRPHHLLPPPGLVLVFVPDGVTAWRR